MSNHANTHTLDPPVVSRERWLAERRVLLAHEKELTQLRHRIAECGLDAAESDGASHRRLDEVRQGFALPEHGFELSAQLRLDADLTQRASHECITPAPSSTSHA